MEFTLCYRGIDSTEESEFWLTVSIGHVEEFLQTTL